MGPRLVGRLHFFTFCFHRVCPCSLSRLLSFSHSFFHYFSVVLLLPVPAARVSSSRGKPVQACSYIVESEEREERKWLSGSILKGKPVSLPLLLRTLQQQCPHPLETIPHPDAGAFCFLMRDGFRLKATSTGRVSFRVEAVACSFIVFIVLSFTVYRLSFVACRLSLVACCLLLVVCHFSLLFFPVVSFCGCYSPPSLNQ
jgi:hypothetical protein